MFKKQNTPAYKHYIKLLAEAVKADSAGAIKGIDLHEVLMKNKSIDARTQELELILARV